MLRLLSAPPSLLSRLAILLTTTHPVSAKPLSKPYLDARARNHTTPDSSSLELHKRCENPCGWAGQLCCALGQTCYTDANDEAQCGGTPSSPDTPSTDGGGYWRTYTTTWVETDYVTKTTVYSAYVDGKNTGAPAAATPWCDTSANQTPCGPICCASGQYCFVSGQCDDAGGAKASAPGGGVYNGITASPPLRPTAGTGGGAAMPTISPTTTLPFGAPVATGAIAGIVVGVLLGVLLLAALCFCCVFRGLFHFVLDFFGLGNKKRRRRRVEETTYVEERRRYGSAGASRGRRWYGGRPARPQREQQGSRFGWMAAGLGALGLVRKKAQDRRRRRDEKSDVTSSYYTYDYATDTSESWSSPRGGGKRGTDSCDRSE